MKRVLIAMEERFLIEIFKRSQFEDFNVTDKLTAKNFISEISYYLEINDFMENKKNKECFEQLYLNVENLSNITADKIRCKLYIEEKTLYRQRKIYVKLINFFIAKHKVIFITDKKCL